MRKFLTLFSVLMLTTLFSWAQRTVSGAVKDAAGDPVASVKVTVEGTNTTVFTDANGTYSIKVPAGGKLVLSKAGYVLQTIEPGAGFINTTLGREGTNTSNSSSNDIVVTGQGIRAKTKTLGTSVSRLKSDEITNGKAPALAPALTGKVAGLNIIQANSGVKPDVKVNFRGFRSFTGNNDALIVLDGVPVPSNVFGYLNPNDVEDITFLKGGQAATIYGSDGVNGAVLITTKKGSKSKPEVRVTSSVNYDQVSFLPEFQDEFGSGSNYGGLTPAENYRPYENQQFGDRFDGSIRPLGRVLQDGSFNTAAYSPVKNARKNVWDIGTTLTNDVSIRGGSPDSKYYLSVQSANIKGIVPKDKSDRYSFRASATKEYGKFTAAFTANFISEKLDQTTSGFYFNVLNSAPHVDLNKFRNWQGDKFSNPNNYWNAYYENPWFELDNERNVQNNTYLNGNIELNYKATNWLSFTERMGLALTNNFSKSQVGKFIFSDFAKSLATTPAPYVFTGVGYDKNVDIFGGVSDGASYGQRLNNDFFLTAKRDFGKFSSSLVAGVNLQTRRSKSVSVVSSAIVIPEIYNVANRTGELTGGESNTEQRKYGYFGDLNINYNDYLNLHVTGRYDGTSVFFSPDRPKSLYQYAYYGADVAFVVTDAFASLKNNKTLSFLKIRAGYNKNGNDNLAPYNLALTYDRGGGFPYGNLAGTSVGGISPDANLSPEFVTSYEAGFEAGFVNNRINVDFTYYKQRSEDQVLAVQLPPSTGFQQARINVGLAENWGFEAEIKGKIVQKKNFGWDASIRYSYNDNKAIDLFGGLKQLNLFGFSYAYSAIDQGFSYPSLQAVPYVRDPATNRVIVNATNGYPEIGGSVKRFGRTIPRDQIGITTSFRYKDFSLSGTAEYRGGHVMYQDIGRQMAFTGSSKATTAYGRKAFIYPNSSYFDGTKYVPNNSIATQSGHYEVWVGFYRQIAENFVTSAAFWKLRDLSLNWNAPSALIKKTKVLKNATVGLYGRNLILIVPKENVYGDPEFSSTTGNGIGIADTETSRPPFRSYGATITLGF
jgi:TonB-linked SusC/RagA family outer membrane protein